MVQYIANLTNAKINGVDQCWSFQPPKLKCRTFQSPSDAGGGPIFSRSAWPRISRYLLFIRTQNSRGSVWFFGRTMKNFGNAMPWNAINLPFGNGINVCRGQNMACGVHPSHTGNPCYEILWVYWCFLKMGDPVIPSDWFGYVWKPPFNWKPVLI